MYINIQTRFQDHEIIYSFVSVPANKKAEYISIPVSEKAWAVQDLKINHVSEGKKATIDLSN